jgi:protein-export membrane protein SecD
MSENTPEKPATSVGTQSFIRLFRAAAVLAAIVWLGFFVYGNTTGDEPSHPFKLGLDLAGGSHLVYEADVSKVDPMEVGELMSVLRDVIERRVNVFGVSEPIVQVESSSFVSDEPIERLVVELPGVSDVSEAVAEIGRTPLLEFKLYDAELDVQQQSIQDSLASLTSTTSASGTPGAVIGDVQINGELVSDEPPFVDTGLTGRFFERAEAVLPQNSQGSGFNTSPYLNITFTAEGGDLFAEITRANVGRQLGIFLDGELLSAPNINEAITGGRAVVTGSFTADEVRELAQNLNFGALPVPIELKSTQTIGASLGAEVLEKGLRAGAIGFSLVILFMLVWYRLPGLVAGVALVSYITIMLALFQYIPVTLTAAGLAGFILSLGMAVDANVLVFERMKEEFRSGLSSREAARAGFKRAWSAILDGNITSLLSAIILFWFGTSLVKGFALVFGLGVIVSMFSALVVTRTLLVTLPDVKKTDKTIWSFLLGNGLSK